MSSLLQGWAPVLGLVPPVPPPPSPWGGGSARCSVSIPCLLEKFPRSPRGPSAPSGAPAPQRCEPPLLPLPAPHTSAPDFASGVLPAPPSSVPPASPFLAPGSPFCLLLAAPPWSCLSVFPAPENSLLPQGRRSLEVCCGPALGTAPSPLEAVLSPHSTPKPVLAGWPPPQRLAWRQQPEECGGWSR